MTNVCVIKFKVRGTSIVLGNKIRDFFVLPIFDGIIQYFEYPFGGLRRKIIVDAHPLIMIDTTAPL